MNEVLRNIVMDILLIKYANFRQVILNNLSEINYALIKSFSCMKYFIA